MAFINAFGINTMRIEHHQLVNARCDTKQVDAGYNPALRSTFDKVATKPKVLLCATKYVQKVCLNCGVVTGCS